jgi:hypothetical protein
MIILVTKFYHFAAKKILEKMPVFLNVKTHQNPDKLPTI